jgi:Macrocin-O-methyltransferase (TylF)
MEFLRSQKVAKFTIRFKKFLRRHTGISISWLPRSAKFYDWDGLASIHNHDFLTDPAFMKAYQRGLKSGGSELNIYWRVHVALWAARAASKLDGDFIECGVNAGIISSTIMEYLDWNSLNKKFYLFDTFAGIDPRFLTEEEKSQGKLEYNKNIMDSGGYVTDVDLVRKNFSQWHNVEIVKGVVPETLSQVIVEKIAFVHLDMNCAMPEYEAVKHFWPRLVPGALLLLDDYAFFGYESQKKAMDQFAAEVNISILSLPTGQGLAIKPPS